MKSDFLVGIITYRREGFFSQCLSSVLQFIPKEQVFVVNDGSPYSDDLYQGVKVIQNETNQGVAKTKKNAMMHFAATDAKYLFLLEDDIIIKRADTFDTYIKASLKTNIEHFNYGPGSPFNRKQDPKIPIDLHTRHLLEQNSEPNPKLIVDYGDDVKIALYQHTVAMFSFFTRRCLFEVGYIDERFSQYNSWEHVSHTQRIADEKLTTPFWWFADIANSQEYLSEAPGAIDKSSIAEKKDEWMKKVMKGRELYKSIHGCYPNETPQATEQEVLKLLKEIYSR